MEAHTAQNVFHKVNWNFWFFDYRNKHKEAPFLETQHTWKNIKVLEVGLQAFSPFKKNSFFFVAVKLLSSAKK